MGTCCMKSARPRSRSSLVSGTPSCPNRLLPHAITSDPDWLGRSPLMSLSGMVNGMRHGVRAEREAKVPERQQDARLSATLRPLDTSFYHLSSEIGETYVKTGSTCGALRRRMDGRAFRCRCPPDGRRLTRTLVTGPPQCRFSPTVPGFNQPRAVKGRSDFGAPRQARPCDVEARTACTRAAPSTGARVQRRSIASNAAVPPGIYKGRLYTKVGTLGEIYVRLYIYEFLLFRPVAALPLGPRSRVLLYFTAFYRDVTIYLSRLD